MSKSDARFGYRAKTSRESFDLGRSFLFTCAPGMLLPIWEDIATPGDSYYIQHDLDYLRTQPLLAPAMVDVKVHFESFFVPMQMIFQPVEQTLFSLTDLQSSNFVLSDLQKNDFPTLNWSQIVTDIVSNASLAGSSYHADAFRLADLFGLNPLSLCQNPNSTPVIAPINAYQPSFFPWQFSVYHCIYEYFYRLDDKSQFNQYLFNLDRYYDTTVDFIPGLQNPFDYVSIHQRAWDFDYFTSLYRSPIVSDANLQDIGFNGYLNDLTSNDPDGVTQASGLPTGNFDVTQFETSGNTSTAAVRQMFAAEKLSMITGRTRKTYDAQVLAHYGVKVPHDVKHDITLIGADTFDLSVGEVTSLSATTDATLGDLAGKGWSQGKGKKHKFVAPCHGVVMTIFSIEPKRRYNAGFDRINAIQNAFDLPTPEFDRLGNQPMFRYEAGFIYPSSGSDSDVVGWKERYYWNKRKFDRSSLAFVLAQNANGINSLSAYSLTYAPFTTGNVLYNYMSPRPSQEDRFYIDRNALDSLVAVPFTNLWLYSNDEDWNQKPWLAYSRDPFIVDSNLKVTKVSWMSKDGEPVYNY